MARVAGAEQAARLTARQRNGERQKRHRRIKNAAAEALFALRRIARIASRTPIRLATVLALVASGVVVVAFSVAPATAATTDGTITVIAYRQINNNTAYNAATDKPQAGLNVTVTDPFGNQWPTTATDAAGQFTLGPNATLVGGLYRVDVSIPASLSYLKPGKVSTAWNQGAPNEYAPHTFFVDVANGLSRTVRVSVWNPADYVGSSNPEIIVAPQVNSYPHALNSYPVDETRALMAFPYDARGVLTGATAPRELNNGNFFAGATFGVAYDRVNERVFQAAFAKSYTSYGIGGSGAIYTLPAGGGPLEVFATVPNAGATGHGTLDDDAFYDTPGHQSLGGIALSEDNTKLYVVNLNDRSLYVYNALAPSGSFPPLQPLEVRSMSGTAIVAAGVTCGGVSSDWRPGAVIEHDGELYIGGVCSAYTTQNPQDVSVHVLRWNGTGWTQVLGKNLYGVPRSGGNLYLNGAGTPQDNWNFLADPKGPMPAGYDGIWVRGWFPWSHDFADLIGTINEWPGGTPLVELGSPNNFGTTSTGSTVTGGHPEPWLSSMTFTDNGDIVFGFRDRFADMNTTSTVFVNSVGDINMACRTGTNSWAWEGDAGCPLPTPVSSSGWPYEQGLNPETQEWFRRDWTSIVDGEGTQGGVLHVTGKNDVVSTVLDPLNAQNALGLGWFDLQAPYEGTANDNHSALVNALPSGGPAGNNGEVPNAGFIKGNGLSALALLAAEPPTQIGDLIWVDANDNGVQDGNEAPIAGVTVQLLSGNTVIATTTTDADGHYYFDVDPFTTYSVRIPASQFQTGGPLFGYRVTTPNRGGNDAGDSDGSLNGAGDDIVTVTTGSPGENDHTIDFGFVPLVDIEKGDTGSATPGPNIVNDADTSATSQGYDPDASTRSITFRVTNPSATPLYNVRVTDRSFTAGTPIVGLSCNFPGGGTTAGQQSGASWTVDWAASYTGTPWLGGVTFTCTATLTLAADSDPHMDRASVLTDAAPSGTPGTGPHTGPADSDDYHAFTGDIQVIKYDGQKADPAIGSGPTSWVTPDKQMADELQDANTVEFAALYPAGVAEPVRWVVTNTGATWLRDITLVDTTTDGPPIGPWSCAMANVGGGTLSSASPTWVGPLAPGASFYCEGPLQLAAHEWHADTISVTGIVVVPATDEFGDDDADNDGVPEYQVENGQPRASDITVTDDDPFNATSEAITLEKGDTGSAQADDIVNDADTSQGASGYDPDPVTKSATKAITLTLFNRGADELYNVRITDDTLASTPIAALQCVFPGESDPTPGQVVNGRWVVDWAASYVDTPWESRVAFTCTATLTLTSDAEPHLDRASVTTSLTAAGAAPTPGNAPPPSDGPEDTDDYHAFTGDIQVIKYDGNKDDPAVIDPDSGEWVEPTKPLADERQDANAPETAAAYPADDPQPVRWVVTNTGKTWLTHITLADVTGNGPAIGAWVCDLTPVAGANPAPALAAYSFVNADGSANPWGGPLAPGASFFCEGPLSLPAETDHADTITVTGIVVPPVVDENGEPVDEDGDGLPDYETDEDGNPVESDIAVDDDDPFHASTGHVDIEKGDTGSAEPGELINDADTGDDSVAYEPGELRRITFDVTNTGQVDLYNVRVTDETRSSVDLVGLSCLFPGAAAAAGGVAVDGLWVVDWADTYAGANPVAWKPQVSFTCTATLTMNGEVAPHMNRATVLTNIVPAGTPAPGAPEDAPHDGPDDTDDYHSYTGDVQVIKYDGMRPDPVVTDTETGTWTTPDKPLVDEWQDAEDTEHAVGYAPDTPQRVRWVVTNTGQTWLTHVTLADATDDGPAIGAWVCDLTPVAGANPDPALAAYAFVNADGSANPWVGPLAPGASFFCEGPLTLAAHETHADTVTVTGIVVPPVVDENGEPVDEDGPDGTPDGLPDYETDEDGNPVESAITVDDEDAFHADTHEIVLEKGDTGEAGSRSAEAGDIVNDADTSLDGVVYKPGERRAITVTMINRSSYALYNVRVTDETLNGTDIASLTCLFPGASTATDGVFAGGTWTVDWIASYAGPDPTGWQPGVTFTCSAQLTLAGAAAPHDNRAAVATNLTPIGTRTDGPHDGPGDDDDYVSFTGDIQVIKYDGNEDDPEVRDTDGAWVTPVKPLIDEDQDANDAEHEVRYPADKAQPVRWVVTNTGATWLADVLVVDVTDDGPSIDSGWVCDLRPVGGAQRYSFVDRGAWPGPMAPGASFFCEGALTLAAGNAHADTVTSTGTVVVPVLDEDGKPVDEDGDGLPDYETDEDGNPVRSGLTVEDDDPFHAVVLAPAIDIEKYSGAAWAYSSTDPQAQPDGDHDTAPGLRLTPGAEQVVLMTITNTGREALVNIVVSDRTDTGTPLSRLTCDFSALGGPSSGTQWAGPFALGASFQCSATLPGLAANAAHADTATVTALGEHSGVPVTDSDAWHAVGPAFLAGTGASMLWLLAIVVLTLIVGAGAVLIARRRWAALGS